MTDSCCGNNNLSCKTQETVREASDCDANNFKESPLNEAGRCCEDNGCKCDDSCLDQLARAICANDAGHIHDHERKDDDSGTDCSTCCGDSEHELNDDCKKESCSQGEPGIDNAPTDSLAGHAPNNHDSCGHIGLRRRHKHTAQSTYESSNLPSEACGQHKSFARKRYQDTLAAFGCICKAMLAHGLQSCCTTQLHKITSTSALVRSTLSSSSRRSSISIKSRRSLDSCCDVKDRVSYACDSDCCAGRNKENTSCCDKLSCSKRSSDCGADGHVKSKNSCCKQACGKVSPSGGCADSCSEKNNKGAYTVGFVVNSLEKGISKPNEHAVLAIRGMTCMGCENKVVRVLRAIPVISNVKTSLVLCRAEFDYDGGSTDLATLLSTIEKRTGFSVESIIGASTLTRELRLTIRREAMEASLAMPLPEGIKLTKRMDKQILAVIYNPQLTGPRQILEAYASFSPMLAPEPKDPALLAGQKHIRTLAGRVVTSALLTIPVLIMAWAPLPAHPTAYAIASLVLATIVQTAITGPIYFSAFKSLFFSGLVETDLLIVLSTTTAYVYSVVAFAFDMKGEPLPSGEFFETSALLVTLIMIGQLISAFARQRAMETISLRSLQQTSATLVHADGREEEIDTRLLQLGDMFKVTPDSPIITDGVVFSGTSEVDESMMTGEARPIVKFPGSQVIAGTLNNHGILFVTAERLPGENTISDIAGMVDDARFSRARVQATVDRVCGWFVPVVLGVAIVTFVVWLAVGIAVRKQRGGEATVTALTYAIAVLAISCPCAIGLAVPMVILIAGGVAAKQGLVFKAATTIESARKITHVVFDKTGTLTTGSLRVVSGEVLGDNVPFDVRTAIAGLLESSRHPVAKAVVAHLESAEKVSQVAVTDVKMVTGQGVEGYIMSKLLRGGNPHWVNLEEDPSVSPLLTQGLTTFCVTYNAQLVACFGLSDTLRPEALDVVQTLTARGIHVSILSGDHSAAVAQAGAALGIPATHVRSSCMPADKQAYIKTLTGRGERVLFCGDGTNDAVALAQADIGVHLNPDAEGGTRVGDVAATSAADVVLIHPSLGGILTLLELSEAVHRRIVLNFTWSVVYNLVAVLFAAGAFVHARIAPAYAGLGEVVSVLPVVLVAVQLKWFKAQNN